MKLPFPANQEQYDAWHAHHMHRVNDPDDEFMFVDLNDGILVFVAACEIGKRHPEKVELLRRYAPEAVELAMTELGILGGIGWLTRQVDVDVKQTINDFMIAWTGGQ